MLVGIGFRSREFSGLVVRHVPPGEAVTNQRGDNSGSRNSSKISTRSRAGVRSVNRPHMPQFYRGGGHSDAPGRRDRRWAASGRKRSDRVTQFSQNSLYRQPLGLSTSVSLERAFQHSAFGVWSTNPLPFVLMSSPSVGFFRAGTQSCCPKNPDQRLGLRTVIVGGRRSEGGRSLRLIVAASARLHRRQIPQVGRICLPVSIEGWSGKASQVVLGSR
jgi:hypothetical protein